MNASDSAYGALLLSGLLGSLGHCLGMCGPLVLMAGLTPGGRGPAAWPWHLAYHAARILVYAALGAVVGALGSLLGLGSGLSHLAGLVSLLLGLGVILLGLGYLSWLPLGRLEAKGDWLGRWISRALTLGGISGMAWVGALNGLLPCGLVYSALLVSASAGSAARAALGMLLFGLGTLPALVALGIGAARLSARVRETLTRVAGLFIVVVGLQLTLRGLAALGVVAHLTWGGVMLW